MKISKNDKKISDTSVKATKYVDAKKHIKAAIDALGTDAKDDVVAKESIANLSVVLLDLM